MTAGDIKSITYTQKSYDKVTGSGKLLNVGTFALLTGDPPKAEEATADVTTVAYGVAPKNVTGEAVGQATPSMLIYGDDDTKVSLLEKGVMAFVTTNGVTYLNGARIKVGTGGKPVLYVEGGGTPDADLRKCKGIVRSIKVVGDGTNTVDIEIGAVN